MKKKISVLLAAAMVLGLAACAVTGSVMQTGAAPFLYRNWNGKSIGGCTKKVRED